MPLKWVTISVSPKSQKKIFESQKLEFHRKKQNFSLNAFHLIWWCFAQDSLGVVGTTGQAKFFDEFGKIVCCRRTEWCEWLILATSTT